MGKLFAIILAIITLVSTSIIAAHVWWLPIDISARGAPVDRLMEGTVVTSGFLFVAAQLLLASFVWRYSEQDNERKIKTFPGGAVPLVTLAVVIVGVEVLTLTFVGSKVWANVYMTPAEADSLAIDVQAEQFNFHFRYAGPDGRFGETHPELINDSTVNFFGLDRRDDPAARDDVVSDTLAIPVNRSILLTLHSQDVGHAFFVRELRIQQDFVPGLVIPVNFTAIRTGKYEIVCTQLCGLGHYSMRAYLEVMPQEQFDTWLQSNTLR